MIDPAREQPSLLLIGDPEDAQVAAVSRALRGLGVEPLVLDSLRYPAGPKLTLEERAERVLLDGKDVSRPGAIYLRSLYLSPVAFGVDVDEQMGASWRRTITVFREKAELLTSLMRRWEMLGVALYNPLSGSDRLRKPYQIARLAAAGLPVPRTLWSNDPEAVRELAAGRRVVYKPVAGGAATRELTARDLTDERLAALSGAPVTFQELLPGDDLRVYLVDGELAAAYRIESASIDFRQQETRITVFDPDDELLRVCRSAASELGLRFTGMDLKRDESGTARILELNDSPMFAGFDARTGTDIAGRLAGALVRAAVAAARD